MTDTDDFDYESNRRTVLRSLSGAAAGSALVAPASAAGSEDSSGLGTLSYESTPAAVEQSTVDQSELALSATQAPTVTQSFLGLGVDVTSWTALYNNVDLDADPNAIEAGTAVGFSVVTTPSLDLLSFQLNPLGKTDNEALLEEFGRLGANFRGVPSINEMELLEEESITVLDQETTLSKFYTAGKSAGVDAELIQYVVSFEYRDDIVFAIGFHSEGIEAKDRLLPFFRTLQYDIDPETLPETSPPQ